MDWFLGFFKLRSVDLLAVSDYVSMLVIGPIDSWLKHGLYEMGIVKYASVDFGAIV